MKGVIIMFGYIKKKDVLDKIRSGIDFNHKQYEAYTDAVLRLAANTTGCDIRANVMTMASYERIANEHSARESELRQLYSAIERM